MSDPYVAELVNAARLASDSVAMAPQAFGEWVKCRFCDKRWPHHASSNHRTNCAYLRLRIALEKFDEEKGGM